jgi:hypothetical protein
MPAATSSVWSRFTAKLRWTNWQHNRYEYPEAHRQPRQTQTSPSSGGVLDPNELLPPHLQDHPLHPTTYGIFRKQLKHATGYILWTTVHAGAMYVFWFHIKPRIVRYLRGGQDTDSDDEEDDDEKVTPHNMKRRLSKTKKRLCCCCDEMVSAKNNFCPHCGAPTCAVCVYCGTSLQNDDKFCNSCGQAVPNQVVLDGGGPLLSRRSSTSSSLGSPRPPQRQVLPYATAPPQIPPPMPFAVGSAVKEDFAHATAESVPMVRAVETFLPPLVPAMYVVEEVTPLTAPQDYAAQPAQVWLVGTQEELDAHSHSHSEHAQHDELQQQEQDEQSEQANVPTVVARDMSSDEFKDSPAGASSQLPD